MEHTRTTGKAQTLTALLLIICVLCRVGYELLGAAFSKDGGWGFEASPINEAHEVQCLQHGLAMLATIDKMS